MIKSLKAKLKVIFYIAVINALLTGCTTVTIDQARVIGEQQLIVARKVHRHRRATLCDYETEPDLINCIGKVLGSKNKINVISEQAFVDKLYPWFEPRTAPVRANDLFSLLEYQQLKQAIGDFDLQYLIWVDGSTQIPIRRANHLYTRSNWRKLFWLW